MKTLGKLKLNQFSTYELDRRKMNALKGGCECPPCSCTTGCSSGNQYESTSDASYDLNYNENSSLFDY